MKHIVSLLFIALLALPSLGCGKKQAPPKKPSAEKVAPSGTAGAGPQSAADASVQPEVYSYDAKGRRDPFLSLVEITKKQPIRKKGASPFESYDVEEFKLIAIASSKSRAYAHIMLPDKKTYTITEGMTLGLRGGKVQKITRDAVIISELVKDYRGQLKPRDSILKLHKGEEE